MSETITCGTCGETIHMGTQPPHDCYKDLKEKYDKLAKREGVLRKDAIEYATFMKNYFIDVQDFDRANGAVRWIEHFTLEEEETPSEDQKNPA